MSPRPAFLSASDYVFYLRKQVEKEKEDGHYDCKENAYPAIAIEAPKLSELLRKLDEDLRIAGGSFVDDFAEEPNNGIFWLLDLLRMSLNRQQTPGMVVSNKEEANNKLVRSKDRQHQFKRAMNDEYDCLLCLKHASSRNQKVVQKMLSYRNGLTAIASCIVSNLTKSRLIAFELLTSICRLENEGVKKVLEAMSAMRVIFGESVRFKLLIAILNSGSNSPNGVENSALTFLNTLLSKCSNVAEKVRLQCELDEAGLDIVFLEKKMKEKNVAFEDNIWSEIHQYKSSFIDVSELMREKQSLVRDNSKLNEELDMLRTALTKLEEDKINLMQIERELKEKCEDLQQEMTTFRSGASSAQLQLQPKKNRYLIRPGSDNSDPMSVTADSGRWSDSDGCDANGIPQLINCSTATKSSKDYTVDQNVRNEDIFIYIPSIRPPAGFQYEEQEIPKLAEPKCIKNNNSNRKAQANTESRWKLRQRNSLDSDNKPTVVDVYPKKGKADFNEEVSCSSSLLGKDCEENELTLNWQYPKKENSRSMKNSNEASKLSNAVNNKQKILSNSMNQLTEMQNENDLHSARNSSEGGSEFFLKSKNTSSLNNVFNGLNHTKQLQKPPANLNKSKNFASSLQSYFFSGSIHKSKNRGNSHNTDNNDGQNSDKFDSISKFPMPNAYKKSFIHKGHGNCDLYSGFKCRKKEKTNEELVHQEILISAKELGNWF